MPAQPTPGFSLSASHRQVTRTLRLENGNNELFIWWLSLSEKRKSLKSLYSKTIRQLFLVLSLPFLPSFPPSLSVYSLGHWQYKLDFQSERKLAFLRGVSKSPEEEKNLSGWHFKSVMPNRRANSRPKPYINDSQQKLNCHHRDAVLCV